MPARPRARKRCGPPRPQSRLKASSVRLIGDAPMPHADGLFPSDHFGVVATFVWE
ncbi:MAG: hypothetical protein KIS92_26325 [Planctomycetota bacterium]|nr:hypothetical protein [Planctomycetota bacterium]